MNLLCCCQTNPNPTPGNRLAAPEPARLRTQDVDKVELVYTKFVSLISSEPTIQTLLPLTPQARPAGPLTGACGEGGRHQGKEVMVAGQYGTKLFGQGCLEGC